MAKRARLWVVSELYYPSDITTSVFMTGIAEGLAADFEVHVLSGSHGSGKFSRKDMRNGVTIHRLPSLRWAKGKLLGRAINAVFFAAGIFLQMLFRLRRNDLVLAVTYPETAPITVGLAAQLRGARSVLLVHDVYPEVLAAIGFLRPTSLTYGLLAMVFAAAFRRFDHLVAIGRDMQEILIRKLGTNHPHIALIPNWGDVEDIRPIPLRENAFRVELGLENKIVLQFSGNMGRTHDIEAILALAASLRDDPRFHVLIVGQGGKHGRAASFMSEHDLGNMSILPRQPREKLNPMLCASDATIITFVEGMYGLSVPSRLYNVMAAGVPVIALCDPRSELALTLAENEAGWVAAAGCTDLLEAAARNLGTPEGLVDARRRGNNARDAVVAKYTKAKVVECFRALFQDIRRGF